MANGNCESIGDEARVLAMFREGKSKIEIARAFGKDKVWVKNALAKAMRGMAKP